MSVKKNYRQVTYHNWRHAFNVGQTMFAIIKVNLILCCIVHWLNRLNTQLCHSVRDIYQCIPLQRQSDIPFPKHSFTYVRRNNPPSDSYEVWTCLHIPVENIAGQLFTNSSNFTNFLLNHLPVLFGDIF